MTIYYYMWLHMKTELMVCRKVDGSYILSADVALVKEGNLPFSD